MQIVKLFTCTAKQNVIFTDVVISQSLFTIQVELTSVGVNLV